MLALGLGGDDFLVKPVQTHRLVESVTIRAKRSRALRHMMIRDSLTGLLTHGTLKEFLKKEVYFARRRDAPVAIVMIDLDHFKQINDKHGHAAGDRVLKGVSSILRKRLRREDGVGRYGGEEFALVLPSCTAELAQRVVEQLRQMIAEVTFYTDTGEAFHVTFSAGIAAHPLWDEPADLLLAADTALYKAKVSGRNQIKVASR